MLGLHEKPETICARTGSPNDMIAVTTSAGENTFQRIELQELLGCPSGRPCLALQRAICDFAGFWVGHNKILKVLCSALRVRGKLCAISNSAEG